MAPILVRGMIVAAIRTLAGRETCARSFGDRLVLTRLYLTISSEEIKSLPAIPLRFDVPANKEPVIERCTITLDAGRLVITFPSGNRMGFRRSTGEP